MLWIKGWVSGLGRLLLIATWTSSTAGNLIVEVLGTGSSWGRLQMGEELWNDGWQPGWSLSYLEKRDPCYPFLCLPGLVEDVNETTVNGTLISRVGQSLSARRHEIYVDRIEAFTHTELVGMSLACGTFSPGNKFFKFSRNRVLSVHQLNGVNPVLVNFVGFGNWLLLFRCGRKAGSYLLASAVA
jgi:hypothetical protein